MIPCRSTADVTDEMKIASGFETHWSFSISPVTSEKLREGHQISGADQTVQESKNETRLSSGSGS